MRRGLLLAIVLVLGSAGVGLSFEDGGGNRFIRSMA